MTKEVAQTALAPTVIVALEQRLPEQARIITDNLVHRILPFNARAAFRLLSMFPLKTVVGWSERMMPGMWSGFLCRKRYIDEKLAEAVSDDCENVVNLGAGFDSRCYRLPALAGIPVWEVDQSINIEAKRTRLKKVLGHIPPQVTLVSIDFNDEVLSEVLNANGYASGSKTFFIWEAVTQYLPEASVRKTFDFLAAAQTGSRLVFTYVRKDFIQGEVMYGHEFIYRQMVLKEKSWLFGMDPQDVPEFLGQYGWSVLEHLGYEEIANQYVTEERGELPTTNLERIVYAEKRQVFGS